MPNIGSILESRQVTTDDLDVEIGDTCVLSAIEFNATEGDGVAAGSDGIESMVESDPRSARLQVNARTQYCPVSLSLLQLCKCDLRWVILLTIEWMFEQCKIANGIHCVKLLFLRIN